MLDIRGAAPGLLDDLLLLDVSGAPPGASLTWRARIRDDDGFVWRATGQRVDALTWAPAKPSSAGAIAALRSLRPVEIDVRVEHESGAAAFRTLTRTVLADGVKARRWRDAVAGTLHLPAEATGGAAILDVRLADPEVVPLAAALLASRGVLVFALTRGTPEAAREALAAVPSAPRDVAVVEEVPLPPGVPARTPRDPAAWDALLASLDARPRRVAR
jgi:hypothetical protein